MPKATVKTAPVLADSIEAAPVPVVPFMLPPPMEEPPEVLFMSLPPTACAETGAVLLEAFLAAAAKASMVFLPVLLSAC